MNPWYRIPVKKKREREGGGWRAGETFVDKSFPKPLQKTLIEEYSNYFRLFLN